MFKLFFENIVKHFFATATSAMASFCCYKNNNDTSMHMGFSVCFFIISILVAVIINLVASNEIICIAIILVVFMLAVNSELNRIQTLNKIME